MKKVAVIFLSGFLFFATAQEKKELGHTNTSKFKQLKTELATPNMFRTASGAPGPNYYQQQVNYDMNITLDDAKEKLFGEETITYINNSPDVLEYLWVQLDQNVRKKDSQSHLLKSSNGGDILGPKEVANKVLKEGFNGGFNIEYVQNLNGSALKHHINQTMMRVDLETPLKPGATFCFKIKWNYNINNYIKHSGRSGFEHFKENNNNLYVIAQFYPRMAVYNDVEGWQNMQFWGRSEFALPFGDFKVNITVPEDHVLSATGVLTNPKKVLSSKEYKRFKKAQNTFDKPVFIVTEEEARIAEKTKVNKTVTWRFDAKNVRDFGFSTSRKFIWDAMAVNINGKTVMAHSLYPKEGNPLWEKYSTRTVAHTLKTYGKYTFDYPYHKAISVHAAQQGMEYPMICWNYGRPKTDGTYSDRVKYGMISVIIHEVGHNFFPMIVNSDERQWTWMDEGLNSFVQVLTEQSFHEYFKDEFKGTKYISYPSRRGFPKDIVPYMSGTQKRLMPIMTQGDHVFQFGSNAYAKPAIGLMILRSTIMGEELFDHAFQTYSKRWKFKHPTPADFFRTMEDASGMDLDWFWRGWFFSTDYTDMGIEKVKEIAYSDKPSKEQIAILDKYEVPAERRAQLVYFRDMNEVGKTNFRKIKSVEKHIGTLNNTQKEKLQKPAYFYEVTYEKPGGLIMPLIVKFDFEDSTTNEIRYPAEVWGKNETGTISRFYTFDKKVKTITVDPYLETADVDLENNTWPEKKQLSLFDEFKLRKQVSKQN